MVRAELRSWVARPSAPRRASGASSANGGSIGSPQSRRPSTIRGTRVAQFFGLGGDANGICAMSFAMNSTGAVSPPRRGSAPPIHSAEQRHRHCRWLPAASYSAFRSGRRNRRPAHRPVGEFAVPGRAEARSMHATPAFLPSESRELDVAGVRRRSCDFRETSSSGSIGLHHRRRRRPAR